MRRTATFDGPDRRVAQRLLITCLSVVWLLVSQTLPAVYVGASGAARGVSPSWPARVVEPTDPARRSNPALVSITRGGSPANDSLLSASAPAVSPLGRFVAFTSLSGGLVTGDTNRAFDAFVRDRRSGVTRLVTVSRAGGPVDYPTQYADLDPTVSAGGRYVAYRSPGTNVIAGDANGASDVFVWDRVGGRTELVSVPRVSRPGARTPNGESRTPSISASGRYVTFSSCASNLVRGDTNGACDIFVRDRVADVTRLVSSGRGGAAANGESYGAAMSADGRHVSFISQATNLVPATVNGFGHTYVRNLRTGRTRLVSVGPSGEPASGGDYGNAISADGRYVVFGSDATDLVAGEVSGLGDVFVWDATTNRNRLVSANSSGGAADDWSFGGSVSADGRYVVFGSYANNLTQADDQPTEDVFIWDRTTGRSRLVSVTGSGEPTNAGSPVGAISGNGRFVAFDSYASNIAPGDTCCQADVFMLDRRSPPSP